MNLRKEIEELKVEIQRSTEKLARLEEAVLEEKDKKWPKNRDIYYKISSCGTISAETFEEGNIVDSSRISVGNIFRTREECEEAIERLKVWAIIKKYTTKKSMNAPYKKYYFWWDNERKEIKICRKMLNGWGVEPWFDSEESTRDCIDEIGEDRLKKYWFNVS